MDNVIKNHHDKISSTLLFLSGILFLGWLFLGLASPLLWIGVAVLLLSMTVRHKFNKQMSSTAGLFNDLASVAGIACIVFWLVIHLFTPWFFGLVLTLTLAHFIDKHAQQLIFSS